MKKIFLLFGFITFATLLTQAQVTGAEPGEKIRSLEIAYLTKQLELTPDEAEKFWPVYNNYTKEFLELLKKRREARYNKNADPDATISADLVYESKMLELKKKYRKLYAKAIPPQKILALYKAEGEFREHLYKQLNSRRKGND